MGARILLELVPGDGSMVSASMPPDDADGAAAWLLGAGGDLLAALATGGGVVQVVEDGREGSRAVAVRVFGAHEPPANTPEHIANTGGSAVRSEHKANRMARPAGMPGRRPAMGEREESGVKVSGSPANTSEHTANTPGPPANTSEPRKVHVSVRIDADLDARVRSTMRPGESVAAAYQRVVAAGLGALGGEQDAPGEGQHVADLREEVASLRAQLGVKDAQIQAASVLAAQAQALAAQAQERRAPWWRRLLGRGGHDDGE